jgi:hypothetical protein
MQEASVYQLGLYLETEAQGGLAAVEKLVKQGLAPAVALTVLGAYSQDEERVPGS